MMGATITYSLDGTYEIYAIFLKDEHIRQYFEGLMWIEKIKDWLV